MLLHSEPPTGGLGAGARATLTIDLFLDEHERRADDDNAGEERAERITVGG